MTTFSVTYTQCSSTLNVLVNLSCPRRPRECIGTYSLILRKFSLTGGEGIDTQKFLGKQGKLREKFEGKGGGKVFPQRLREYFFQCDSVIAESIVAVTDDAGIF
jgi:hypothetical protein